MANGEGRLGRLRLPFGLGTRLSPVPPRKALILQPCCLGRVMLTTPLLAALGEAFPDARFDWAVSDWARRKLIASAAIVGIVGLFFGWIGALLACAVAVPLVWKLEHHYFFGRNDTDEGET